MSRYVQRERPADAATDREAASPDGPYQPFAHLGTDTGRSTQAVALADITVQLNALTAPAGRADPDPDPDPDPARVHLTLRDLLERFSGLAENARAFMSSLQRTSTCARPTSGTGCVVRPSACTPLSI